MAKRQRGDVCVDTWVTHSGSVGAIPPRSSVTEPGSRARCSIGSISTCTSPLWRPASCREALHRRSRARRFVRESKRRGTFSATASRAIRGSTAQRPHDFARRPPLLPARRFSGGAPPAGNREAWSLGAGLQPSAQGGADDRRSGGCAGDQRHRRQRGDSVPRPRSGAATAGDPRATPLSARPFRADEGQRRSRLRPPGAVRSEHAAIATLRRPLRSL